jgi:hypothetical protein
LREPRGWLPPASGDVADDDEDDEDDDELAMVLPPPPPSQRQRRRRLRPRADERVGRRLGQRHTGAPRRINQNEIKSACERRR